MRDLTEERFQDLEAQIAVQDSKIRKLRKQIEQLSAENIRYSNIIGDLISAADKAKTEFEI